MKTTKKAVGFLFGCTKDTIDECLDRHLFGSPDSPTSRRLMTQIYPGSPLFLFNYTTRELTGPFAAVGQASRNLIPGAFNGRFPVQVEFSLQGDKLMKLQESEFKSIIKDNYYDRNKFSFYLTKRQVNGLHALMRHAKVTRNQQRGDFKSIKTDDALRTRSVPKPLLICSLFLRKVLLTPPHLRPPMLFRRPDTIEEIPFPPSDTGESSKLAEIDRSSARSEDHDLSRTVAPGI
eukprot:g5855.t1